ncbi:MAG: CBS domain-containing protein [Cyclobacteriaceae bacterium]|jgi:CBS domain-containing protein|nr:CBS domain-containing protein [Cyclobacteriaceae bacterium]
MKKREPVTHIMTNHVYSVEENESLEKVITIFRKHKIRHLPVTKNGVISGMISSTDINRLTFGRLFENQDEVDEAILHMLKIPQVMTEKPRTISPDTTIMETAAIFAKEDFHALPVVENSQLKGIVTTTDVIRYLLEQY